MGVAIFTIKESSELSSNIDKLYGILSEMDGVIEWALNQEGEVAVEYDHNRINEQTVEQALSSVGLQLMDIVSDPNVYSFVYPNQRKISWNQSPQRSA